MKKVLGLTLMTLASLMMCTSVMAAVTVGKAAPDFSLQDVNEQWYKLSDFRGKFVVLEWVNYDCPFVKKHYKSGNMQKLQKTLGAKDIVWLSINSSAHGKQGHFHPDEVKQLLSQKGAQPAAYLMDFEGEVGRAYGAKTTPHMYVVDPSGKLIYQGAIDSIASADPTDIPKSTNYVTQALEQAINGQQVSSAVTAPYGCSVKY